VSVHVRAEHFSLCEAKGDLETYASRRRFGTAGQAARRIAGFRQQSGGSLNVNYPIWPDPRCGDGGQKEGGDPKFKPTIMVARLKSASATTASAFRLVDRLH
jgi:hypothetical protein